MLDIQFMSMIRRRRGGLGSPTRSRLPPEAGVRSGRSWPRGLALARHRVNTNMRLAGGAWAGRGGREASGAGLTERLTRGRDGPLSYVVRRAPWAASPSIRIGDGSVGSSRAIHRPGRAGRPRGGDLRFRRARESRDQTPGDHVGWIPRLASGRPRTNRAAFQQRITEAITETRFGTISRGIPPRRGPRAFDLW